MSTEVTRMIVPCLLLAACAAGNPGGTAQPAVWQPPAKPAADPATAAAPPASAEPAANATNATTPAAPSAADAQQTPASEKPAEPAAAANGAPAPAANADPIVAYVAGKPVFVSELMAQWLYADSDGVRRQLDNLAVERLVVAEATRLGVKIDPELAEKSY
jgi:hypothetical protein